MERHPMRKIREVLRLRFECKRSQREISAAIGISGGSVCDYLNRARRRGLTWAEAEALSDSEVEARLFTAVGRNEPVARAAVDFEWVAREMRRPGVTLQLLWTEYRDAVIGKGDRPRPYQYSQFCDLYRAWRQKLPLVMRQEHRAGEKAFVDYSGVKLRIADRATGELTEVELFVMVLGASNFTYAEATKTQTLPDFLSSHVRGFAYFGCVPAVLVPDQLRSAVSVPARHDPDLNTSYAELAKHYGIAVIPARPKKPRDKAKVEVGVQIAQRWIVARLRNRTFFSLGELNEAIAELLEELNERRFAKLEGCRRSAFEAIDRPAMRPLPLLPYEVAHWTNAKVNIDYHVEYEGRLYSVPHTLVRRAVEIRATTSTIEVLHDRRRVASHVRSYRPKGTAVTEGAHRPKSHRDYGDWPPSRVIGWAGSIGPNTAKLVEEILSSRPHPEQGYRASLALIRNAKRYGRDRMEAACARAIEIGSPSRKSVEMILKRGLDRLTIDDRASGESRGPTHENVRGGDYYDTTTRPPSSTRMH
ncbi:MAG: IS21 family transposase [Phycisphaeraceae bacterium]|nr:IS21 family transposase [Phycisphaeraceae bacterium]